MKTRSMLIVDPQNDFMHSKGSLYVLGADDDSFNISNFIKTNSINEIYISLDTHHRFDIAHSIYWVNKNGNNPEPFTIIQTEDILKGIWSCTSPNLQEYTQNYLKRIENESMYNLCIWPPHCIIGTWGNNVESAINDAISNWEQQCGNVVNFTIKGMNFKTEHYSAIKAEVPDYNDDDTMFNYKLVHSLIKSDELLICGEASSHCLAATTRDIVDEVTEDEIKKIVLLSDCMSPVQGFEKLEKTFFEEMQDRGVRVMTSMEILT